MDHRAWQTTSINLDTINPMTLFCFILLFQNRISFYNPAGLKVKILPEGGEMAQGVKVLVTGPGDLSLNPRLMRNENQSSKLALTSIHAPPPNK